MKKEDTVSTGSVWSRPVVIDKIGDTGLHVALEAPPEVRAAAAQFASVREVSALAAEFDLSRRGRGVHVSGRVQARVGQTCVVSLDPVETVVDEAVDLVFAPPAKDGGVAPAANTLEAADAQPEPLVDGKLDLGALAVEFLLLGIDPYPRKPGVEFAAPKADDAREHPFAALATLKKRSGDSRP